MEMVLIGLIVKFGLPVVFQLLGRAGVTVAPDDARLAENGLSILSDLAKSLHGKPKVCWYAPSVGCGYEAAPLCGLGLEMAAQNKGLDDLTISTSGVLYVAANSAGQVIRLDPRTKASCVVASGLTTTSAVKQGRGRAFPSSRLYVTGFDGKVLELTPPRGVSP